MGKCIYKEIGSCSTLVSNKIHDGTKLKFEAFADYTQAWLEKVINFDISHKKMLKTINFIDCMASSGLYYDKDMKQFYEGTAIKIFNIFVSSANKYKDIDFHIFLNDFDEQFVKCLDCAKINVITKMPDNLNVHVTKMDKYEFIERIKDIPVLNRKSSKNLIIYDPYGVDFNWNILKPLLNLNADFLFTHFYPNDLKRNISTTSKKTILRYEEAYEMNIEKLKTIFYSKKSPYERNALFRDLFEKKLKEYSNKKCIAYAPVFNSNKAHVYDIVCLSHSNVAKEVLKNTMYKLYKKLDAKKNPIHETQLELFKNETIEDIYYHDRKEGISEYNFYYDDSHIIEMFSTEFKGKKLLKSELNEILINHPYLPSNILKLIKTTWTYKIEKIEINGRTENLYVFPDRSVYEQN